MHVLKRYWQALSSQDGRILHAVQRLLHFDYVLGELIERKAPSCMFFNLTDYLAL